MHSDHISAVISVDYSPTGREFVSGSYDKTIRLWGCEDAKSREVYYTKRMQRLTSVLWTLDNKYILCGSDEMDVRIWKANRSEKLGMVCIFPFCYNTAWHGLLQYNSMDEGVSLCVFELRRL